MRTGTCHFMDKRCAVRYYAQQHIDEAGVDAKLANKEIRLGAPPVKPGEYLTMDEDGRYWINTAFVARSPDMTSSWDPFYHDFMAQYQLISRVVLGQSAKAATEHLTNIIRDHEIRYQGQRYKFHPQVIENLKEALCGEDQVSKDTIEKGAKSEL